MMHAPWQPAGDGMPYGLWEAVDGREILFDRCYCPLWQRSPGGAVTRADPREWVEWKTQNYFFDDTTPRAKRRERQREILTMWGIVYG